MFIIVDHMNGLLNKGQRVPASHMLILLFHRLQFESHVQQESVSHLAEIQQRSLIVLLVPSQQRSATPYFVPHPSLLNSTPLSGKVKQKTVVRFVHVKELIPKKTTNLYHVCSFIAKKTTRLQS